MKRILAASFVLLIVGWAAAAQADDKSNPTGTWKWTMTFGNQSREVTLKLKLEGDKLTGAMLRRNGTENPIQNATYKAGEVSFQVVHGRQGQQWTSRYTGKVSADTITGKVELGNNQSREWVAKRVKE
jgi:hypothetical protein